MLIRYAATRSYIYDRYFEGLDHMENLHRQEIKQSIYTMRYNEKEKKKVYKKSGESKNGASNETY